MYKSVMQVKQFSQDRGKIDLAKAKRGRRDPERGEARSMQNAWGQYRMFKTEARQSENHVNFLLIITKHNYTK